MSSLLLEKSIHIEVMYISYSIYSTCSTYFCRDISKQLCISKFLLLTKSFNSNTEKSQNKNEPKTSETKKKQFMFNSIGLMQSMLCRRKNELQTPRVSLSKSYLMSLHLYIQEAVLQQCISCVYAPHSLKYPTF